jgi:U3 small nucleolar RNA-associated protein 14
LDEESAGDDEDEAAEGASGQNRAQKVLLSQQELRRRAFAGDEVEKGFAAEKENAITEEGDKLVDNTLPGWGSWVGEGINKRQQDNRKDKFVTKIDGVKREKRADAKLPNVIISERRIKKVGFSVPLAMEV